MLNKLNSEYLTQDGIQLLLEGIKDTGCRYIYYDPEVDQYLMSVNEPVYQDGEFLCCVGNRITITNFFLIDVLSDIIKDEYIDILDYIDETDWSKVPVDTKVLEDTDCIGPLHSYFAKYENGKVYVWANGRTSWSAFDEDSVISLPPKTVHLAKDDD